MTRERNFAVCAIGRMENRYAKEFVAHYESLGFTKLYLYDNNHGKEERFEDVLGDEIARGLVEVVNWRDREDCQKDAYADCYRQHGDEVAWMAFFDFDEFLILPDGEDIYTFMQRYRGFDCLFVNWMVMDDNDLIRYEDKPQMERFTRPMPVDKHVSYNRPENDHVKCIVRGRLGAIEFKNPHRPKTVMRCCNTRGEACRQNTFHPYDFSVAYIKHFTTRTIEEWLNNKVVRGYPNGATEDLREKAIEKFWQRNYKTKAKEAFIKQWQKAPGHVAAYALGRLGNQMFCAAAAATYAERTGREFEGLVFEFEEGKKHDYNYPAGMFGTVMQRVPYLHRSELEGYVDQEHGGYLCNGFPTLPMKNVVLNDFYQDVNCIDRHIALHLFRSYESILMEIQELYGNLSDYVCVNVRRGDYLKPRIAEKGFRVLTKDEIDEIIDTHFPEDKIFFVSDDIEWCKENFKGERYRFADKPCRYKPEMDLYLQTMCKGNVISNSTFSWWGAFLNEHAEKVVCPWPWFEGGKICNMKHLLPPNWIKWKKSTDYKIWITYHRDNLVQEYGLREDEHNKLFAVHKPVEGENINHLNPIYSELVTIYYVWKNQIKSDYVGFNHYRRRFEVTRLPGPNECQVFRQRIKRMTIYEQYAIHHNKRDMDFVIDIVAKRCGKDNPYEKYIREGHLFLGANCFLMSWNNFNRLCNWLFPILFEFAELTGCGDDIEAWRQKEIRDFGGDNIEGVAYQMRIQGFLAERLVSAWIITNLQYYV